MSKVHLDFGHGGGDPGAVANGMKEKDVVLFVGLEVGKILRAHGVTVSYSRTTDVFVSLGDRTNKANREKADIVVSIHVNSATNKSANGVETFSHVRSTKGKPLAKAIQNSLVADKLFKSNRGIKTANFHVLRETIAPAALTELGFIPNVYDAVVIRNKQKEMAISTAKGILNFLGIKYISTPKPVEKDSGLVDIKINDFMVEGIFKNNTNYVPVRVLEKFGLKVSWNQATKTVEVK